MQGKPAYQGEESCSWLEIERLVKEIAFQVKKSDAKYDCILGIANGAIIPAKLLSRELGLDAIHLVPVRNKTIVNAEKPALDADKKYLIINDIYDMGDTYSRVAGALKDFRCDFCFCMSRHKSHRITGKVLNHNRWILFSWV